LKKSHQNNLLNGKSFDIVLLFAIILSILTVMLDSIAAVKTRFESLLDISEIVLSILFTLEYGLRLKTSKKPLNYIFSFLGIVDLLAILPFYIGLFFSGAEYLAIMRALRLLRIFRIFKLRRYLGEADVLVGALKASRYKIIVFIGAVLTTVTIMGTITYLIEGEENGFTSIPRSIYWAIVTLTTVGYGDIAPRTAAGQTLASFIMLMGYGIIAVPTGMVTKELTTKNNFIFI